MLCHPRFIHGTGWSNTWETPHEKFQVGDSKQNHFHDDGMNSCCQKDGREGIIRCRTWAARWVSDTSGVISRLLVGSQNWYVHDTRWSTGLCRIITRCCSRLLGN